MVVVMKALVVGLHAPARVGASRCGAWPGRAAPICRMPLHGSTRGGLREPELINID